MNSEILNELLLKEVKDLYDAEKQLVRALPKMAKASESEDLADAFRHHLEETKEHVARLEQVFELLDAPARGKPCKGMKGLVEEGSETLTEEDEGELRDLVIIGAAQRVEHYEIAAYGTARAIAEQLGNQKIARLLRQTEDEEKAADEKLSECAKSIYETEDVEDEEEGELVTSGNRSRSRRGR